MSPDTRSEKMENENKQTALENWQTVGIGVKDIKRLEPNPCKVLGVGKVSLNNKKRPGEIIEKIVFSCKHPERETPIEFSDCQLISKKEVVIRPTWLFLDEDGSVQKGSTLAQVLFFYQAKNLNEMVGKEVKTAVDDRGYICLKAY